MSWAAGTFLVLILIGVPIGFAMRDDRTEPRGCPHNNGGMCTFDQFTGKMLGATWRWASCCTDGLVLENLPTDGRSVPFTFDAGTRGIDTFKIGQWNRMTQQVEFIELDAETVLSGGFSVQARSCTDFCGQKTSCGECSLHASCAWNAVPGRSW